MGVDPTSLLPRDVYAHNDVEAMARQKMEARRRKMAKEKMKQLLAHREMMTDGDVARMREELGALATKVGMCIRLL